MNEPSNEAIEAMSYYSCITFGKSFQKSVCCMQYSSDLSLSTGEIRWPWLDPRVTICRALTCHAESFLGSICAHDFHSHAPLHACRVFQPCQSGESPAFSALRAPSRRCYTFVHHPVSWWLLLNPCNSESHTDEQYITCVCPFLLNDGDIFLFTPSSLYSIERVAHPCRSWDTRKFCMTGALACVHWHTCWILHSVHSRLDYRVGIEVIQFLAFQETTLLADAIQALCLRYMRSQKWRWIQPILYRSVHGSRPPAPR